MSLFFIQVYLVPGYYSFYNVLFSTYTVTACLASPHELIALNLCFDVPVAGVVLSLWILMLFFVLSSDDSTQTKKGRY